MEPFELPEDLTGLDNDALAELLEQAVTAFDELSGRDEITAEDLATLRRMRNDIKSIEAEQTKREEEAQAALDEIEGLRNEVLGEEDTDDEDGDEGTDPEADAEGEDPEAGAEGEDTEPTAGEGSEPEAGGEGEGEGAEPEREPAVAGNRPLNIGAIRSRQPRQPAPEPEPDDTPAVTITASADVPGFATGADIDLDELVTGVSARAKGLSTGRNGTTGLVASYRIPFPENLQVHDTDPAAGTAAVVAAADQSRLPGGDLVASGGWCAPSETVYDITDIACPDMLWSPPEVQLTRGGLRFFQTPTLDVSSFTWIHTEADDIAGNSKPCFTIPCPDPIDVRCDAVGVCLESGILTERTFPELVSWYVRNSMVAHEIRISTNAFAEAVATATSIDGVESAAAFTAVFGQVALHIADLIEKHSLCEGTGVEVVFPFWARNLFLADIARQNGRRLDEIDPALINSAFATIGASVSYARGLAPGVPTEMGGDTPADAWPAELAFLVYPAGAFELGRGAEVDLGAVFDSAKFVTNDHTALFTEECVALINRGPEARFVTVPVCPDGETGAAFTAVDCPIDAGTVVS